jgi:hypothetical protein
MAFSTDQITVTGTGSLSIPSMPSASSLTNIVVFDSSSGQFSYTSSAAVGGGGESYLPLAGGTMDSGSIINFYNGSRLKEGTTDAGLSGNGGIALKCSVDYELKWDAGRLFVMTQNGFTIRESLYNLTVTPTANDDDTKGYIIGSRWTLDNGITYVCTDASTSAAVWEVQTGANTKYLTSWTGNYEFPEIYANERILLFDISGGAFLTVSLSFPIQSEALEGSKLTVKFVQNYNGTLTAIEHGGATYRIETPTFTYAAGEKITWVYNSQQDKWFLY